MRQIRARHLKTLLIMAAISFAGPAWAQNRPAGGDEQLLERQRRLWRERMEQTARATPEERRQMRVDWQVSMMTQTYELNDEQRAMVRAEFERSSREYRKSLGRDAEQMDRLRREMREFWRERTRSGESAGPNRWQSLRSDPKFIELRERMQTMRRDHPYDWQDTIERVEKLLPEDQVTAGRERRRQWIGRWSERGDGFTDRPEAQPASSANDWAQYTKEFIERHKFDAAQTASARAILGDVEDRAVSVRRTQEDARAELAALPDGPEKKQRLQALDEPLRRLFAELQNRLQRLVTEQQRREAHDS